MVDMHVCQELWSGNSGPCAGYLLTIINDYLSLSSPKEDGETKVWMQGVCLGNES